MGYGVDFCLYASVLDVGRCAELVAVFFGIACEALCRYSHVFTIQDRTQTSASVPCGWSFSRGCGIGSGCCGGGVILLGLRESALLCQGLLFEPKASSAPGTMILADSRSLSSIRRRSPARTDVTSPAYVRSTIPAYAPSMHRKRRPPQTETAAFPSHIIHRKSKHRKILIY